MCSSRMTRVLQQRALVVFVPPDLLEELVVEGYARASSDQSNQDEETDEGSEDTDEGFSDDIAEAHIPDSDELVNELEEPDPFYDWDRSSESSTHERDLHEDLLQRIGAFSRGRR